MHQFSGLICQGSGTGSPPDDVVCLSENLLFGEDEQDDDSRASVADGKDPRNSRNPATFKWLQKTMKALTASDPAVPQVVFDVINGNTSDVEVVAKDLALGLSEFNVFVRQATSTRNKATCLTRLWHKSIILEQACTLPLINSADDTNSIVVDLAFRESFRIPNPSPRYNAVLELLPETFAAYASKFFDLVEFLAEEMAQEFLADGLPVPPWRTPAALRSKWSKATSFDVLVSAHNSSMPKPAQQQQQKLLSQHHTMDVPRHVVLGFSIQASNPQDAESRCISTTDDPGMAQRSPSPAISSVTAAVKQQHKHQPEILTSSGLTAQLSQQETDSTACGKFTAGNCQAIYPLESLLLPVRKVKLGGQICLAHPPALVA